MAKLTIQAFAQAKGFTAGQITQYGVRCTRDGKLIIPYYDLEGNQYIRYRIRASADDGKGFAWSKGDAPLLPYGLHRPVPVNRGAMWIVEGESDCWAMWTNEIPAMGIPGASNAGCLKAAHLAGVDMVLVVQEPGEAGSRFPHLVAQKLYDDGFPGNVFAVTLAEKDPRALLIANPAQFREKLGEAFRARKALPRPQPVAVGPSLVSIADVFDLPTEETKWLVDGLLPEGGIALIAAKAKAGKSVFGRNMALSVSRGRRFLGRTCQSGAVAWLALEERKEQVIGAFKAMGVDRTDPLFFHFGAAPGDAYAWLRAVAEQHRIVLLVVDTWHKLTLVDNVNDYAEVNRANAPLMALSREHGIAQLWIHHANKGEATNGDQVLGSSALFAAADVLLSMRRANDGTRTISSIQRVGTDLEDTIVEMDPETFLMGSAGSKYIAQVSAARAELLRALLPGPMTRPQILSAVDARKQIIYSALNEALRDGLVMPLGGTGKRGDPVRWGVTEMGSSTASEGHNSGFSGSHTSKGTTGTTEPETLWFPSNGNHDGTSGTSGTTGTRNNDEAEALFRYAEESIGEA